MPYNNNPIPRPATITGSVSLPLARVKKIIQADEDINACSANAAFAIAVATEEFVYYLTEQAHKMAKAEKKPKRSLGYTHVQQAVARLDNLEFLTDVVPKTQSYKDAKAEREKKKAAQAAAQEAAQEAAQANGTAANGQSALIAATAAAAPSATTTNGQLPLNGQQATAVAEDKKTTVPELEPETGGGDAMDLDEKPASAA
ncbi:histone-like transcription factor and archaeal histone family protein [Diplodia corticola]|uniref:Histone-like transcription factor and archaeal histone family protein n=1 Tax=Diplodia corticola TaxID=236234 RepID=A0A1J9R5Q1_9PEZI|nr:histone-like transcription factor and archaeal histone family protein [Diplodia corticola]OJD35546.1 histone-like transcription factor and archaeal histone family protein [Diplodia corticola]